MTRLSIRPRPLDFHKKLAIVKSVKDFDDKETPTPTRNSQVLRFTSEVDNELHHHVPNKRVTPEIPTPEFLFVDTYERDYSRSFSQPTTYIRARGVRAEIGEFVEYDLDNEDEDWLEQLNKNRKFLTPEKLESLLFKLEVLDHKTRERASVIAPTFGSPIPVLLQLDAAAESQSVKHDVLESVYNYWKEKRERWQKPVLRRLQPPPPVNDINPYNVFRPREKAHRLHTRRMQRRENNVQSFEKLRQVRRNLDQAKTILEALIKREEKKREVMENEVTFERIQIKYKYEADLLDDSFVLPQFMPFSSKFNYSEDELVDSEDVAYNHLSVRHSAPQNPRLMDMKPVMVSTVNSKQESRWQNPANAWLYKMNPLEPVMAFTKPLVPDKLAVAGIRLPSDTTTKNSSSARPIRFHGRIGRGGRIIFDRWNPLSYTPINCGDSMYISPRHGPSTGFI